MSQFYNNTEMPTKSPADQATESIRQHMDAVKERPRKKKPPADQAMDRLALQMGVQETILKHTNHMLKVLTEREDSRQIWERKE
jgi:hypothetical protein